MTTTRLDQFDNSDYNPGPWLVRVVGDCLRVFFQTWFPWPSALKRILSQDFRRKNGVWVVIKPRVTIKYPWKLAVGDHTWIGENVWIDNLGQVTIGGHCCLSQGALLLCGNHNYKKSTFDLMVGDITLEDGVWIGVVCMARPGATCGSHSVLAIGSTATKTLRLGRFIAEILQKPSRSATPIPTLTLT